MVFTGTRRVPPPVNEPIRSYAPGAPERTELKARLAALSNERIDIPIIIGGKEVRTGQTGQAIMPHNHRHVLADWHKASPKHVEQAIGAARRAPRDPSGPAGPGRIGPPSFSRPPNSSRQHGAPP